MRLLVDHRAHEIRKLSVEITSDDKATRARHADATRHKMMSQKMLLRLEEVSVEELAKLKYEERWSETLISNLYILREER